MATQLLVILSIVLTIRCPQIYGEDSSDDLGNFADLAAELFQSQGAQGLGSMMQGLMGSGLMSGMLAGNEGSARSASNLGQVLQGLGNMVGPDAKGIDTDVLSGIMGMIGNSLDTQKKEQGGIDMLSILSTIGSFLSQPGNAERIEQFSGFIPMVMDFMNAMYGPEAKEREKEHATHSWLFPPIFERFHLLADHFMSSQYGKAFMQAIGAEKVVKIFSDESGEFSYDKFVELMENHSFRRHWLHMLVLRIGKFIEYYANPTFYEQYVGMAQFMINGYLSKQGYPKYVMLKSEAPIQSLSGLINFLTEKYVGTSINSEYYIQPLSLYVGQIFDMMKNEGLSRGGTEGISAKLADSINLEIIEPIARVNRAYRYLKKNRNCDKYVLCLVNQKSPETTTLPGMKLLLSRGTSFVASWALSATSKTTNTPMMEYLSLIMYEEECQKYFKPECSDYHDEEIKVTTEYIHNEL